MATSRTPEHPLLYLHFGWSHWDTANQGRPIPRPTPPVNFAFPIRLHRRAATDCVLGFIQVHRLFPFGRAILAATPSRINFQPRIGCTQCS